jgi:transposase-like protein
LTGLKNRGVEDILITVTDNLNGFTDVVQVVFPQPAIQLCVVHQNRSFCKYVVCKEMKEFTADMKENCTAVNRG